MKSTYPGLSVGVSAALTALSQMVLARMADILSASTAMVMPLMSEPLISSSGVIDSTFRRIVLVLVLRL